jgi:hypothetical protein
LRKRSESTDTKNGAHESKVQVRRRRRRRRRRRVEGSSDAKGLFLLRPMQRRKVETFDLLWSLEFDSMCSIIIISSIII